MRITATPVTVLDRLTAIELGICLRLRPLSNEGARAIWVGVSRAGDGWLWLVLALLLPILAGARGWDATLEMLRVGAVCQPTYQILKRTTARPRPCSTATELAPLLAPLDTWSFPSGHTLHAVAFTIVAGSQFPELLWVLAPFTALVALSRLALSLHYPSDVAAGAGLGALIAWIVP